MGCVRTSRVIVAVLVASTAACGSFTGTDLPSPGSVDGGTSGTDASSGGPDGGKPSGPPLMYKRVFVTSYTYIPGSTGIVVDGAFTGVTGNTGAEAVCQYHAWGGSKTGTGTYLPWIGSPKVAPATTFDQSMLPYKLVDGTTLVAMSWSALLTGGPISPISLDEDGKPVTGDAWTATNATGSFVGAPNCSDWTVGTDASFGAVGSTSNADSWTAYPTSKNVKCNIPQHIYCFEQ